MSNFAAIELSALEAVTGGNGAAPNQTTTKATGNLGVTYKGTQVGVQGGYESSTTRTNPAECAAQVRAAGGSPSQILDCFKPQGQ
ncbi:MAG: hypothetical protein KBG48_06350 [Kofleriaceae bacterium]|nr:hypothetical protein [Kofleriaceae bacterium]MBP9166987.1 hypothetical protein [Kofleriaceae bacterium]MBP9858298.1 hypothetical protein [Kofleriaceae bacterium]